MQECHINKIRSNCCNKFLSFKLRLLKVSVELRYCETQRLIQAYRFLTFVDFCQIVDKNVVNRLLSSVSCNLALYPISQQIFIYLLCLLCLVITTEPFTRQINMAIILFYCVILRSYFIAVDISLPICIMLSKVVFISLTTLFSAHLS